MKEYFETLNLKEGASKEAIQEAYDRLSGELNPSNNDNQEFFIEEYEKVQKAYKALYQSSILKNSEASSGSFSSKKQEDSSSSINSSDSFTVTISKEKIEQLKNRKLDTDQIVSVPVGLKTLSILSMIGSGFFALIFLGMIFTRFSVLLSIVYVAFAGPFVLKIIGALKMYQGKKSGYKTYIVPSIILNIIFVLSIVTGYQADLISSSLFVFSMIIFSILFHNYKDQLK